jgi:hypothetical protein
VKETMHATTRLARLPFGLALLAGLAAGTWTVFAVPAPLFAEDPAAPTPTFEGEVKPILRKHCLACHNAERPRGDLDLSSFSGVMTGGISGPAVVAGKSTASLLYTLTAHLDDPKMPPNKPKIPQREIDTIARWIDGGLPEKASAPAGKSATTAPANRPEAAVTTAGSGVATGLASGLATVTALARPTPITALAVSPVAPLAAVPGNKQVLVVDLAARKLLGALPFPEGEVHALRFSRDGQVLIAAGGVGGQSGRVVGFEVGRGKRLFAVGDETDAILAADISPDKSRVAFGGPTRLLRVVSVADGTVLHTHRKATDWITAVAFSPDGLLLAAGDRFGGLYVWETRSGKEFAILRGHTKGITALAWRADSDLLASAGDDRTVRLWNLHTGQQVTHWEAHDLGTTDLAFGPDGRLLTGGRDGRLRLWEQPSGRALQELGRVDDMVTRLAWTADGQSVISGDWAGQVKLWPLKGGEPQLLPLPIQTRPSSTALVPVPVPNYPTGTTVASAGARSEETASPTRPSATAASTASGTAPAAGTGTGNGNTAATSPAAVMTSADLERKRAALRAVEEAVERLKDEAARDPKNTALTKAYLQLCEAALVMKAEVLAAEAAIKP